MDDYITVLLDHLSEQTRPVYGPEAQEEHRTLAALEKTFSPEQKKLFLAYEDAQIGAASAKADAFARAAFLLARDIFR